MPTQDYIFNVLVFCVKCIFLYAMLNAIDPYTVTVRSIIYIVYTRSRHLVIMITNGEIEFVTLGMFSLKASHSIGVVDGASHLSNFVKPRPG